MPFDQLPERPPMHFPAADAYSDAVLARSRAAAALPGVRLSADRAYGSHPDQRLDIYAPAGERTGLPVLVFVHGGAWVGGYKEWAGFMAPALLPQPAILVSVEYRLAPEHVYPAAVQDVAAALKWVQQHIAEFGGDPGRILLSGHSAGAHLASLVALDPRWLAAEGLGVDCIRGVLPISGLYDLQYDTSDERNRFAAAICAAFVPESADLPAASPLSHVSPRAAPFHIIAGQHDLGNLASEAVTLCARLQAAGVPATINILPGHDHFDAHARCVDPGHVWLAYAREMLGRV